MTRRDAGDRLSVLVGTHSATMRNACLSDHTLCLPYIRKFSGSYVGSLSLKPLELSHLTRVRKSY